MIKARGAVTLVLAALVLSAPGMAQRLNLSLTVCDAKDAATWIQQGECKEQHSARIIAWPLFWFDNRKDPKQLEIAFCLATGASCGLDLQPRAWWLGLANPKESAATLSDKPQHFHLVLGRADDKNVSNLVGSILQEIERQTKLVELSWRLGPAKVQLQEGSHSPIFRLRQTTPPADRPVNVGDCGVLPLGELGIRGARLGLITKCQLPYMADSQEAILKKLMVSTERPFQWTWQGKSISPAEEIKDGETVEFRLFPYEMGKCERMGGAVGYKREGVPRPAQTDKFLLLFSITFDVPAPINPQYHPTSGIRIGRWDFGPR